MKQQIRRILALALCLLVAALCAACSSTPAATEKDTLVVGLDDSFPPMGYRDADNNIVGFDIDLATEVCSRLGIELKLQPIDWDSKELELSSGAIDCIWNGMSVNEERLEAMFIPKAYIANKQIIIVPADSDIKTKDDLKDKVVGAAGKAGETVTGICAACTADLVKFQNRQYSLDERR